MGNNVLIGKLVKLGRGSNKNYAQPAARQGHVATVVGSYRRFTEILEEEIHQRYLLVLGGESLSTLDTTSAEEIYDTFKEKYGNEQKQFLVIAGHKGVVKKLRELGIPVERSKEPSLTIKLKDFLN